MGGWRVVTLAAACVTFAALSAQGQQQPAESQQQQPAESKPAAAAPPAAPQYSRKGADSCIACHDDAHVLSIFKTRHARRADERTPFGHGQLQCEACHGPGGAHAGRVRSGQDRPVIPFFDSASTSTVEQKNGICLTCHETYTRHNWAGSAHEREGLACASCHTMHEARDPVLAEATQPEKCMDCHPRQRAQSLLPYAHPVRQDRMACSACHSAHGTISDFALIGRTLNDTCFSCHADKRGPFLWEHAPVTEDCALCHEPHGSNHPGLLTQRRPLLCQQCHSEAGHPSVPLASGQLPPGAPSAQVLGRSCMSCHSQVHGSNHPSGAALMR